MEEMTTADRLQLINDIATRAGTAKEIAKWYGTTATELRAFTEAHRAQIQTVAATLESSESSDLSAADSLTVKELDALWISKKVERLNRYEAIADKLFHECMSATASGSDYATALRELRSYMVATANELGQLLHRGSGDAGTGDTASYDIPGVDLEQLR